MPKTSKRVLKSLARRKRERAKRKAAIKLPQPKAELSQGANPKPAKKKLSTRGKLGILATMAAVGGLWNPKDLDKSKHSRQKAK